MASEECKHGDNAKFDSPQRAYFLLSWLRLTISFWAAPGPARFPNMTRFWLPRRPAEFKKYTREACVLALRLHWLAARGYGASQPIETNITMEEGDPG